MSYCRKGQNQAGDTHKIETGRIGGYLLFTAKLSKPWQNQKVIILEKFPVSVFQGGGQQV